MRAWTRPERRGRRWLLAAVRALFGTSLFALHLLPALAACANWLLLALLARELGGGRVAQTLAAVNGAGLASCAQLGVVLGIGLLNKLSVLWLGFGLTLGLLLTPSRRLLATPGPWLAAAIALALFSPHVIWQLRNDLPTLEGLVLRRGWRWLPATVATLLLVEGAVSARVRP
jgi:hypothetical protein